MSSKELILKPKDVLFEEGDQSKNLYFVKKGIIRIFKRKAEGNIEIDTIRAGQILGELAFFDGQPRSASAEALTACEVIEMSQVALEESLKQFPDWLVALTKTVASRLRTANNRIRTLETMSAEYGIDKNGVRTKEYVYVNSSDLLRFCTALLAVSARYGKTSGEGTEFSVPMFEKFAGSILQLPSAKVTSLIELFKSVEILKGDLILADARFLDLLIQFLSEQNLLASEKKQNLSETGFRALTVIYQNRTKAALVSEGIARLNVAPALKAAGLQPNHLQELFDQSFVQKINLNSGDEINVDFDPTRHIFLYRTFWLLTGIERLNEEKRKKTGGEAVR